MRMNWDKQKSHHSLYNHILPTSWISRFKQSESSCDRAMSKGKKTGQLESPSPGIHWREGRFYSADDEFYWRLSFGDEEADTMKMFGRENSSKLYDVVCKPQFSPEKSALRRKKVREFAELKRGRSKSVEVQSLDRAEEITTEADQKAFFKMQPERVNCSEQDFCHTIASNSQMLNPKLRATAEEYSLEALNSEEKSGLHVEADLKNERRRIRKCQRKRRKVAGRSKSCSPRTGARTECKIKGLEDIKKAKMMRKKKNEREPAGETEKRAVSNTDTDTEEEEEEEEAAALGGITSLDGYAVIKNSVNPREDFRESMVEMILENDIERPEELEELLACYLTLNDDKNHDLIVKVFREVWLQLNELCFTSMLQDERFYHY